ncbi:MAG: 50S ribosomal protein L13 [Synergistetes bacterium]|nr:50S ribosomal protein L13 [Synergistota bacterium]
MQGSYMAKHNEVERKWYVIDASKYPLGRMASRIAIMLQGKHKANYTPHVDTGDFIIVINAEKVKLSGKKAEDKVIYHHSDYPGGLKEFPYKRLLVTHPERIIERAVWGMLPKTKLGRKMFRKLKVYRGSEHPHEAQKPEILEL